jgi:AAA domain-containing protein
MQKLFISALRIVVVTSEGNFGVFLPFKKGLNILSGENTSGKSTTVNSILYALGFEILLGKTGIASIKPVLKSELEYEGKKFSVLESYVELEIKNSKQKPVTLKRQIIGDKDNKLIKLNRGSTLTESSKTKGQNEFYYVGIRGAAQREKGFHSFLADFLGIKLPLVPRYEGDDVPLYLECLFPLMFIEQVRGWGGIQMTLPKLFGIQNVAKVAFEFVLKMDVSEIQRLRQEIAAAKKELKIKWNLTGEHFEETVKSIAGIISNYPDAPTASLEEKDLPYISMLKGDELVTLDSWIISARDDIIKLKEQVEKKETGDKELEAQIEALESGLMQSQASLAQSRTEYFQEQKNIEELIERIEFIDNDIKKNQDVSILTKYGADKEISLVQGICPTCHQEIMDTLLEQTTPPLSIEKNIEFLKQQKQAATILLESSKKSLKIKGPVYEARKAKVEKTRKKIRDFKRDLVSGVATPQISTVRELIEKENRLELTETVRETFETDLNKLKDLSEQWRAILAREAELPKDAFSDLDKEKIRKFSELFSSHIQPFGFRSVFPGSIAISKDNYRPILEDFEMYFDASASDNIRLIWAYTIALQEMEKFYETNHFGITFFDEPGQQQISNSSRQAFYKIIGEMDHNKNQVIVSTSEDPTRLREMLKDLNYNLRDFGYKAICPLN